MQKENREMLRVRRSKEEAIRSYNRLSRWYDALAGGSEKKCREAGLRRLQAKEGETILEIGFGTGHCILELAESVGEAGKVYGMDISERMLDITRARIAEAGLAERVELECGDALHLPYADSSLDAIFMSFTLELFDTPELEPLLRQCQRVLKKGGRMCVVAMSRRGKQNLMMKLYEWAHVQFPNYVDCRPIYAEQIIRAAGFEIVDVTALSLWGLAVEVVLSWKR
jgi:demethylmenaquinone methyltransferase/2-methoxy-6-polyprenyl-1,4-benzoquinol methylase